MPKSGRLVRIVADTIIVVLGFLWRGNPRRVLDAARLATIQLFTSPALIAELDEILQRDKFAERLLKAGVAARELVLGYASLATILHPTTVDPVILADPDDDEVLACAIAATADAIVSGDSHLLELRTYKDVETFTATQLLSKIGN